MAIKAPTTSTKPALYKMVSLPSYGTATGTKQSGETKVVQSSYKSFITSINKIGATINSTIIVNQQILKTLQEDLTIRSSQYDKMKSSFQKEKAGKDVDGTDEGGQKEPWWKNAMSGFAKAVVPNFFEGLAQLGQFFLRAFVVQGVLRWMSDPKNGEKLANIVGGLVKIFSWLYKFVTENIFKTIEGLVDMFDGDKNIWERIVGFGKFITGFGALLLGMTFLKKPALVIRGFTWVLTTLYKNLFKTKTKLAQQAGSGAVSGATSARGGGRGRGLATFAAGAAAGAVLGGMMGGGTESPAEQSDSSAPPAPNEPLLAAGGIATKPTSAILGERGPELSLPLSRNMPIPADNEKRRRDAGIKPLSSLGSFSGGDDQDQANNLSKLFMAPFKGIGAGILANISQVVASIGGKTSNLITPILGNLIAPIANSFGVPPSIVKTIQGKMGGQDSSKGAPKGRKKNIEKLFGKSGSLPSIQEKKFSKRNDNSVLGLLTDILGASIVINNKLGGDKEQTPPPAPTLPPPSPGASATAPAGSTPSTPASPSTGAGAAAAPKEQQAKDNKPENGGWITGPMSGYPVSLDGGNSIAFEGHGTEWVGFKNFSTGLSTDAFVVPFNTPATKSQPDLINKRLKEASAAGYSIPKMARGGRTRPKSSTSGEKPTEKGTDKKQGSGGLPAVVGAGKYLLSRGFTVAEHKNFTKNNWDKNGPNTGTGYNAAGTSRVGGHSTRSLHYKNLALDITDWRGGDWQGRTKALAEEMYRNRSQLKLTQIIHDPWGSWFAGGGKGGAIGGHDSHLHLGFASGPGAENLDIQGGDYTSPSGGGGGDDTTEPEEKEKTPEEQIQEHIAKIKSSILQLSGMTGDNVSKATEAAKTEKDRSEQAANQRINNAAASAMKNAKTARPVDVKRAYAMEPIILPGPKTSLPIEALNPSTSMIQYGWKVNL